METELVVAYLKDTLPDYPFEEFEVVRIYEKCGQIHYVFDYGPWEDHGSVDILTLLAWVYFNRDKGETND